MISFIENSSLEQLLNEFQIINEENKYFVVTIIFNVVTLNYVLIYKSYDNE